MNRHQRDKERIDYKILSEAGNKISKEANLSTTDNQTSPRVLEISNLLTNFSMTEEQKFGHMDQISVDQLKLAAVIRDVIGENQSDEIISINTISVNENRTITYTIQKHAHTTTAIHEG